MSGKIARGKHVLMISGVPGSGKSTAAISVARALREVGFKVKIANITGFHGVDYLFLYALAWFTYNNEDFRELIKGKIHPISLIKQRVLNRVLKLVMALEILSIHLAFLIKIFLPFKLEYEIVIVDEGTINTIGNYIATLSSKTVLWKLVASILRLTKEVSLIASLKVFFLNADNSVLITRWKSRGYPPQMQLPFTYDGYLAYLKCLCRAKDLFERMSNTEVVEIDTSLNSPSDVVEVVLNESNLFKQ